MAGPYPPQQPGGPEGLSLGGQPFPGSPPPSYPYPAAYPGPLPAPVGYPKPPRRNRALLWTLLGLGLVGALVAVALFASGGRSGGGSGTFSDASAKAAIQSYLTALSDNDTETVARNNGCGMFDAAKDRKSDLALARLASDAFRKQFAQAEVTSIDKIVPSSSYQAQVLFTMKVQPASTSRKARDEEQGVAHLLRQDGKILVCSYLLRTAAQY
ncbi:MAG: hypothetical protein KIH64_007890 [Mycobacterium sp.]|nr:hypothetical protein [Mycobacterium sp.]